MSKPRTLAQLLAEEALTLSPVDRQALRDHLNQSLEADGFQPYRVSAPPLRWPGKSVVEQELDTPEPRQADGWRLWHLQAQRERHELRIEALRLGAVVFVAAAVLALAVIVVAGVK